MVRIKIVKKLSDFYNKPFINGIFYEMSKDSDLSIILQKIGINEEVSHSIDVDYIYNNSGLKSLSCLLYNMIKGYVMYADTNDLVIDSTGNHVTWDYVVTKMDQQIINTIIKIRFKDKWTKLIETLNYDYDPLSPYQMKVTDENNSNLTSNNTDSSSDTFDSNSDTTNTTNETTDKNIYGFNGADQPVPSEKNIRDKSDSIKDSTNSSRNRNGSSDYTREENNARNISRTGNIGNHTQMELIEGQRDVLQYQILSTIYSDLDSVLTRSKYSI